MADATTWARVEPNAQTTDIDVGLAAEVADPLWFLARQMQLGEFDGSDGGSLLSVEIRASWSRLSRYHAGSLPDGGDGSAVAKPYDATKEPLEKLVESEPIEALRAWRVRVAEGQRLEAALRTAGLDGAIEPLRQEYPFQVALINRVVLALQDAGPVQGWDATAPRARLAPRLEAWVGRLLGDPSRWVADVVMGKDEAPRQVKLTSLPKLSALDVIFDATTISGTQSVLAERLIAAVDLPGAHVAQVSPVAAGTLGWNQLLALAGVVREMIGASRPLTSQDLLPPDAAPLDEPLPAAEIAQAKSTLDTFVVEFKAVTKELDAALIPLRVEEPLAADVASARVALSKLVPFGVVGAAQPQSLDETSFRERAEIAVGAADGMLRTAESALAKPDGTPDPAPSFGKLLAGARGLFGPATMLTPMLPAMPEIQKNPVPADGRAKAMDEWLIRLGGVRPSLSRLKDVRMFGTALSLAPLPLHVTQLPFIAEDGWLGATWQVRASEDPRRSRRLPKQATTHLVLVSHEGLDPSGALAGLVVDEFSSTLGALPSGVQEQRYGAIFGNRALDGLAVHDAIAANTLPAVIAAASGNARKFEATLKEWADTVPPIASADTVFPPAWKPERQEYTFAVSAPGFDEGELVLQSPEYDGSGLDWYHVDLAPGATLGAAGAVSGSSKRRYLPKPVTFPGMPVDRFWEMEDGLINLGSIDAGPTDIVRMLATEYAIIYSPDWFLVPLEMPVGSIGRVDWVTARDTFGVDTLVGTFKSQGEDQAGRQFQLARVGEETADLPYLFLPPACLHGLQSAPLEDVLVQRDEQANMAWIIERVILGPAGRGVAVARPPASEKISASKFQADLIYQIATEVPPNWSPLVAVPFKDPADDRITLKLRRARLLETPSGTARDSIGQLATGIRQLFEEEVTRAGVRLQLLDQVARWLDGSHHVWRGRRKSPGLGESDAGLFFDYTAQQV